MTPPNDKERMVTEFMAHPGYRGDHFDACLIEMIETGEAKYEGGKFYYVTPTPRGG